MNDSFSYHLTKFFKEYLPNQIGVSINTIKSYRDTMVQLLEYINKTEFIKTNNIKFENISDELIENFLVYLEETRRISISTRNQRLAAIHSFFRYVQRKELACYDLCNKILSIRHKKTPGSIVSYMSIDEIKFLFSLSNVNDKHEFRHLTIITLLYESACRVQELIDLKLSSLKLTINPTIEVRGKGNKTRLIPISIEVSNILTKYIKMFNITEPTEILFKNKYNCKLTRVGVQYVIDKYISIGRTQKSEYFKERYSNHSFRHSKAMHLLEAGVNLIYIRDILGHSSIVTTEIYAKTNANIKRKIIETNSSALNINSKYTEQNKEDLINWLKTSI